MAATAIQYRKTKLNDFVTDCPIEPKRARRSVYFRLASESLEESNDDTESVYSLQGKETECVKDTTDTETETETDAETYEVEIEYEVESLSDSNGAVESSNGSEAEDLLSAAAAAIDCFDKHEDVFLTDAEESDNSQEDQGDGNTSATLLEFWNCIQCNTRNKNPQYRLCDRCFQDRKLSLPPRPRGHKKLNRCNAPSRSLPKKIVQSALSQDSGIGSSQELGFVSDKTIPAHLSETASTSKENRRKRKMSETSIVSDYETSYQKKRKISETSILSDLETSYQKKIKKKVKKESEKKQEGGSEKKQEGESEKKLKSIDDGIKTDDVNCGVTKPLPELKEKCIICNSNPKNSVFLHGRIAHMCCCYKCAMRTWKKLKRCPICNRKVSNVVRVFTT